MREIISIIGKRHIGSLLAKTAIIIILLLAYQLLPNLLNQHGKLLDILIKACETAIIIYGISIIDTLIKTGFNIIHKKDRYRQKPLKGFMQILQLTLYFIGAILIVAALLNKSPKGLLTGLGAFAAVLSFIFKDTILGFVAGIQLAYNDMIRPGDWIVVHNGMADGTVLDINLISVTIQNWDNTIVSVPTYSLINTQFQNWRGMEQSDGRRITINLNIDANSVHFCEGEITNLELYRMHLLKMITKEPQVNHNLTFMVRYLQGGPYGIPLQIYCFSKNKSWVTYEAIKAAIQEKATASAKLFNIKIYQICPPLPEA